MPDRDLQRLVRRWRAKAGLVRRYSLRPDIGDHNRGYAEGRAAAYQAAIYELAAALKSRSKGRKT
jgi:hypothetical protein